MLTSDLDFEVLSYVRTEDGFLTAMHDVVRETGGAYRIPMVNPGTNPNQVSRLRLVNAGDASAAVRIAGTDDRGTMPDAEVRLDIPAGQAVTLSSSDIEAGAGLKGMLGDGAGKWRMEIASDAPLVVMNLLESPTGHLANLSRIPPRPEGSDDAVYRVPFFPAAGNADGRQGFVRTINHSGVAGSIQISASDDSETEYDTLALRIEANAAVHFNSDDLELGNSDKGLWESTGAGVGDWRLRVSSPLDIEALTYIRTPDGFLTGINATSPTVLGSVWVPTFNPANNPNQVSHLRLVNYHSIEPATVTIEGVDDRGASPGTPVVVSVPAGATRTLSATDLEAGAEGLEGALGDGRGKWRLKVSSEAPVTVMSLLRSPTGHLTNLSTAPDRAGN